MFAVNRGIEMKKTPNTNTRECEKSVEVSDNFKTLRYKINFHTKTVISPNTYDIVPRYMVEVVNYVRDVPLVIYERMFDKHQDAMDDFERNVHNYQTFI